MNNKMKKFVLDIFVSILTAFLIAGFSLVIQLIFFNNFFEAERDFGKHFFDIWYFIIMLFVAFSTIRAIYVDNQTQKEAYLEKNSRETSFVKELKVIFSATDFWIKPICISIIFLIMPSSFGLNRIEGTFFVDTSLDTTRQKLFSWLIFLLMLLFISFLIYLSVHRDWKSTHNSKKARNPIVQVIRNLCFVLFSYSLIFMGIPWLIPFIITMSNFVSQFIFHAVIIIVSAILIPLGFLYLRAILKQKNFMKALRHLCDCQKYRLEEIQKPYSSVFHNQKGYNFSVSNGEKEFRCKVIAGVFKGSPMAFSEKGNGICRHTFRIAHIELFHLLSRFDYTFESEETKILIIVPVPHKIMAGTENTKLRLADNGEIVGKYQLFTAHGFLSSLERNCLGIHALKDIS